MADASFIQDSFLGGEWSASSQGRFTDDRYRLAMNDCFNAFPTESGPWARRVGTRFLAYTRKGRPAKLIPFAFAQDAAYEMEFTDGKVRFHNKDGLVLAEAPRTVTNITTDNPGKITTIVNGASYADGDSVLFIFPAAGASSMAAQLLGRQFVLTLTSGNTEFTLVDAITGATLDGSSFFYDASVPVQVARILELTSPYVNETWKDLRYVQDEDTVLLLHPTMRPYTVQGEGDCATNIFQINAAYFVDGPYLDPVEDGSYLTPSAQSGQITLSLGYPAWDATKTYANGSIFQPQGPKINGTRTFTPRYVEGAVARRSGVDYVSISDNNLNHQPPNATYWRALDNGAVVGPSGFTASDIGRLIRLNSEPGDWAATSYTAGAVVKYKDEYWTAASAVVAADIPGVDPIKWGIASNASLWTWGIITAAPSNISITVQLVGGDLLYATTIRDFRLGAWSDSTAWPTCATYHEGRFWIGGAIPNRFDATKAGKHYSMQPTGPDGTVADDNAIAYVFDSPSQNKIVWFAPDDQGIIAGTAAGEWVIKASSLNDPLTPTSIQAKQITRYGCAAVQPVRAGTTLCFVQRFGKSLYEYVPDGGSKFAALNLSRDAKHLTEKGILELAYQQELNPIIWARIADGSLTGTTYKRSMSLSSQSADFNGWHHHELANGRLVESLVEGPSPDGLTSSVTMVTNDPTTNIRFVEQMTQVQPESSTVYSSWFLDSATNPKGATITTQNNKTGLQLSGLWPHNGRTVSAFVGGLDLGDFTVDTGSIFIPFTTDFTEAFLANLSASVNPTDFSGLGVTVTVPTGLPTQLLQMYQEPHQFTDVSYLSSRDYSVLDIDANRVFLVLAGNGPDSGIASFNYATGDLVKFSRNAELWGFPIPEDWSATTVYQTAPQVLATNSHIYASSIDGNVGIDPITDAGVHWSDAGTIPGIYSSAVTYGAAAHIATVDGFLYFEAVRDLAGSRDPLADDGRDWLATSLPVGGTPPLWSQALTFHQGDVVRRENITAIWSSVAGGNLNHNPVTDGGVHWTPLGTLPAHWSFSTAYQSTQQVTGSNGHQFANLAANNLNINPVGDAGVHWEDINSGPARNARGPDMALGYDGFLYVFPWNYFSRVDKTTLTEIAGGATTINPFSFVAVQAGARNYLIATQFGVSTIGIFDTNAMKDHAKNNAFTVTEGQRGCIVGVPPYCACGCSGRAIILGINYVVYADNETVGLYTLDIEDDDTMTFNKSGTIAPTDFDSDWVRFTTVTGFALDETDGNPLIVAVAHGTPTHPYYVAKVNANTGDIMWKTAVTGASPVGGETCMKYSKIRNGEWALHYGDRVTLFDTRTGASTDILAGSTYTLQGGQSYDDTAGKLTFDTQFTQSGPIPVLGPNTPANFGQWAALTVGHLHTSYTVPGVVGFTYESRGQVVRPEKPEEAGARNGPAMGKTRRTHMYAMRLLNTTPGMKVGTDFTRMRPLNIKSFKAVAQAASVLYSGEHWDTLEDGYSFSSQLAWKVSRPYPAMVLAITQFLHTQDR